MIFKMDAYRSENFTESEKYGENEPIEFHLTPDQKDPPKIYFEVNSQSAVKFTHIEKCHILALDKFGDVLNAHEIIKDGCSKNENFASMSKVRKFGQNSDRFRILVYAIDNAESYQFRCRLHACSYFQNAQICTPSEQRYDWLKNNDQTRFRKKRATSAPGGFSVIGTWKVSGSPKYKYWSQTPPFRQFRIFKTFSPKILDAQYRTKFWLNIYQSKGSGEFDQNPILLNFDFVKKV
jgi:hypothetical protein